MPFLLKEEYVDCVAWFSGLLINGLTLYSGNQHFFWSIKFNGTPLTPTKLQQRIIHAINQTLRMEKKIATSLFSRRCKKPILTYSAFCIFLISASIALHWCCETAASILLVIYVIIDNYQTYFYKHIKPNQFCYPEILVLEVSCDRVLFWHINYHTETTYATY